MNHPRQSLAQHFAPEENYRGLSGWLCGFSADAGFMNLALEHFTGYTKHQRASQGNLSLMLMADPMCPILSLTEVSGLGQLLLKNSDFQKFRLQHAKVAILLFQHEEQVDTYKIRLLVSTGNWTCQTLEESLDLAWSINLFVQSGRVDPERKLDESDIAKAWAFMSWLQKYYDTRILEAFPTNSPTYMAFNKFTELLKGLNQHESSARFIDNRQQSLLTQVAQIIDNSFSKQSKNNYLAMGSGFFEQPQNDTSESLPEVLQKIVEKLQVTLIHAPTIEVYVNPDKCQGLAQSRDAVNDANWALKLPSSPAWMGESPRDLHAKFLISAKLHTNNVNNAWIYLGSGNLTRAGFLEAAHQTKGNLEAGVVFFPESLTLDADKPHWIGHFLPIRPKDEKSVITEQTILQSGTPFSENSTHFAPPIPFATLHVDDSGIYISTSFDWATNWIWLDYQSQPCARRADQWLWRAKLGDDEFKYPLPRIVTLEVEGQKFDIPIMDELGRLAATALPVLSLADSFASLLCFPAPPDDDDAQEGRDDVEEATEIGDASTRFIENSVSTPYAIRQMMTWIETIAQRQCEMSSAQWPMWCNRLQQVMGQISPDDGVIRYFRDELKINPLSPLFHPHFKPDFACNLSTEQQQYEAVLLHISQKWGVQSLTALGAQQ